MGLEGEYKMQSSEVVLSGGNMNSPILKNQLIYKEATSASRTIHELLVHVREQGITWIPESRGINSEGKHVLTYLEGEVPHDTPEWLWQETIMLESAKRLRQWHDATVDFKLESAVWLLKNDEEQEVICHNDFAPYNCVFQDQQLIGVIDFDVCSPGSRLWDIAYTAYRFVPLFPCERTDQSDEVSPFSMCQMIERLGRFLDEYSRGDAIYRYGIPEVTTKVEKRLLALAEWSQQFGVQSQNEELTRHAKMYMRHATWINKQLKEAYHCDQ
jgi:thiamine kinase-like enzyme